MWITRVKTFENKNCTFISTVKIKYDDDDDDD